MMYMHYCRCCNHVYMLNGHKLICPKCVGPLTELRISYLDYAEMNHAERLALRDQCSDPLQLRTLSTTYRMYKYSKWYRELQATNFAGEPVTSLLAERCNRMQQKAN